MKTPLNFINKGVMTMTAGQRVGNYIKAQRKACGLTQEQMANDLYMSLSYLRQIENGKANPTINLVAKINSYLRTGPNSNHLEG